MLAGGQSLVPTMAFRLAKPAHLVDINGVAALKRLTVAAASSSSAPACAIRRFTAGRDGPLGALLPTWCGTSRTIRSATAAPFAAARACRSGVGMVPVPAALDGEVLAQSARGERVIAAAIFKGIMTTALADDELLVEARLPLLPAGTASASTSSTAAPAISPWPWRSASTASKAANQLQPRPAVGAAEVGSAAYRPRRARARLGGGARRRGAPGAVAQAATAATDPMEEITSRPPNSAATPRSPRTRRRWSGRQKPPAMLFLTLTPSGAGGRSSRC